MISLAAPTQTTIRYIATPSLLSIVKTTNKESTTQYVSDANPLFKTIVELLPQSEDLFTTSTDILTNLKQAAVSTLTGGALVDGKLNGIDIPTTLADRIVSLSAQNLPYQPLIDFWTKLQANTHLDVESKNKLFEAIGTVNHPLTWDGSFIAYSRANGIPPADSNYALRCSTLSSAAQSCTDAGVLMDFLINPESVTSFKNGAMMAAEFTKLSILNESHTEASSLVSIEADSISGMYVRRPYNRASAFAAISNQLNSIVAAELPSVSYKTTSCD